MKETSDEPPPAHEAAVAVVLVAERLRVGKRGLARARDAGRGAEDEGLLVGGAERVHTRGEGGEEADFAVAGLDDERVVGCGREDGHFACGMGSSGKGSQGD